MHHGKFDNVLFGPQPRKFNSWVWTEACRCELKWPFPRRQITHHHSINPVKWSAVFNVLESFATPEVFPMMKIQGTVFWVVTLCSVIIGYRRFGRQYCLDLPPWSSETLVSNHITKRCHNPEDSDLNYMESCFLKSKLVFSDLLLFWYYHEPHFYFLFPDT
jgi:hypothetical protein